MKHIYIYIYFRLHDTNYYDNYGFLQRSFKAYQSYQEDFHQVLQSQRDTFHSKKKKGYISCI
jgi:hypothetical protein